MKSLSFLLTFMFILTPVFANDKLVAERLTKGDTASFTGVLITDNKAKELFKMEQQNILLKDLRLLDKELIEEYKTQAKRDRENLSKAEFRAFWTNTGYFALGVILSSLAFKATKEIAK